MRSDAGKIPHSENSSSQILQLTWRNVGWGTCLETSLPKSDQNTFLYLKTLWILSTKRGEWSLLGDRLSLLRDKFSLMAARKYSLLIVAALWGDTSLLLLGSICFELARPQTYTARGDLLTLSAFLPPICSGKWGRAAGLKQIIVTNDYLTLCLW